MGKQFETLVQAWYKTVCQAAQALPGTIPRLIRPSKTFDESRRLPSSFEPIALESACARSSLVESRNVRQKLRAFSFCATRRVLILASTFVSVVLHVHFGGRSVRGVMPKLAFGTVEYVGTEYGGWAYFPALLRPFPIVYSVGLGTDLSWDLALIERHKHVKVFGFDGTPVHLDWFHTFQRVAPEKFLRNFVHSRYTNGGRWTYSSCPTYWTSRELQSH